LPPAEHLFYYLNMRSVPDLTAAAAIRTAAMRLFAERGFAAVTVRDVAAAAGVSAPLVMHHYGSKGGLREAVDEHAWQVLERLFEILDVLGDRDDRDDQDPSVAMSSPFADLLEHEPDVTTYLRRLLVDGGPRADRLFERLYRATLAAGERLRAAGVWRESADDEVLAAFLLVNDLGAVVLRDQVRAVLGLDPLAGPGLLRWSRTVLDVYGNAVLPALGREEEP
jgi:TetR/AcrR family transcriptional regulator, regulator of cefoperazone and chloramphenicol sensitivity